MTGHFRKIWNETTNGFIFKNKEMVNDYKSFYAAFIKEFPYSQVTYVAFKNQCSRLGVVSRHNPHVYVKPRPLYSEHQEKGYIRIKIAQPNVWISKAKWVYMETHPWEDFSEDSEYIFLDGDNRNFHPENIERLPRRICTLFVNAGGNKGGPEIVKLRIAQCKLKMAMLDAGDKLGLTVSTPAGRQFIEERNAKARAYYKKKRSTEEGRQKMNKAQRDYVKRVKEEGGEKLERFLKRTKEANERYYLRKKLIKGR